MCLLTEQKTIALKFVQKTARGRGGIVEEVRVDNIIMKNIKEQAVVLDIKYTKAVPEPVSERTPKFRNIHLSNITG